MNDKFDELAKGMAQSFRRDGILVQPCHQHRPPSGLIEFHDTSLLSGQAFYRALAP
jgi:hypothetical protein